MPKNKTHKGTAKRIRVTSGGKLQREQAGRRHKLEHKPAKLKRELGGLTDVAPSDQRRINRLLGR